MLSRDYRSYDSDVRYKVLSYWHPSMPKSVFADRKRRLDMHIHSVMRLKDTVIFTKGDIIERDGKVLGPIHDFTVERRRILAFGEKNRWKEYLPALCHVRGVWCVHEDLTIHPYQLDDPRLQGRVYFDTWTAAKQHVYLHTKYELTPTQILKVLGRPAGGHYAKALKKLILSAPKKKV